MVAIPRPRPQGDPRCGMAGRQRPTGCQLPKLQFGLGRGRVQLGAGALKINIKKYLEDELVNQSNAVDYPATLTAIDYRRNPAYPLFH